MSIFDYDDGDFIMGGDDGIGFDSDGDMMLRIGNGMAMDMDSGDIHIVSGWDEDDED